MTLPARRKGRRPKTKPASRTREILDLMKLGNSPEAIREWCRNNELDARAEIAAALEMLDDPLRTMPALALCMLTATEIMRQALAVGDLATGLAANKQLAALILQVHRINSAPPPPAESDPTAQDITAPTYIDGEEII